MISLWKKKNIFGRAFCGFVPRGLFIDVVMCSEPTLSWCCFSNHPPFLPSQCNTNQLFWGNMLALEWVHQTVSKLPTCSKEAEWPFVAPSSHVHSGRKLRWEPVRLPIYLLGKHLRRLHLIWTKWWQNVVRYLQELWWWPQMGLLSRPRYENSVCGYFPLRCQIVKTTRIVTEYLATVQVTWPDLDVFLLMCHTTKK